MSEHTNKGGLWKNPNITSERSPVLTGTIDIEGKIYSVSCWKGDSTNPAAPLLTLRVSARLPPAPREESDDDIPF